VSVVFRADGLPPASRVDYWREIISNVFLPLDLRGEIGPTTPAELRTTEIGPIRFTESVTGPGASFRTGRTPRLIRNSDPDVCLVGVLVEGEVRIDQDGRQAVLRPGDLSFTDPARPFEQSAIGFAGAGWSGAARTCVIRRCATGRAPRSARAGDS
jgi:AraC-binding-like domain